MNDFETPTILWQLIYTHAIQKLYLIPLFYGDSKIGFGKAVGEKYLEDTLKNIANFSLVQRLAFAHADICSEINFEENRYNLFANIMLVNGKTDVKELIMIRYRDTVI